MKRNPVRPVGFELLKHDNYVTINKSDINKKFENCLFYFIKFKVQCVHVTLFSCLDLNEKVCSIIMDFMLAFSLASHKGK